MANRDITKFHALPIALLFFAISLGAAAEQWTPPQNPDPEEIRQEAANDAREKRYELASQKYVWYHENALKYQRSLVGVRVSFALMGWRSLANQYPPALQEMRRAQDRAEEKVKNNLSQSFASENAAAFEALSAFQDASSLNRVLKEDHRTIKLFKWLGEQDPDYARLVYGIAQDALVEAGEYALCEAYLMGPNSYDGILEDHERQLSWLEEHFEGVENVPNVDSYYVVFARKAAYMVAILVNRNRLSDAKVIADKAMRELKDESQRSQIEDALRGVPPKQLL